MQYFFTLLVCFIFSFSANSQAAHFSLVTASEKVTIVYDEKGALLDSVSAYLLAADIERVSAYRPLVTKNLTAAKGNIIAIGSVSSPLMQGFSGRAEAMFSKLRNQWECYGLKVLNNPSRSITKALLITGSDARGTAYGVFSLSEKIGVSPWWWWADVPVKKQKHLVIRQAEFVSASPSVKYRGIFINDEDWGLLPWASRTFEPGKKNIGPRTYTNVFELLLRLKANLIWPAMHPGTTPFFTDPENREVAKSYAIIIGSSHAEPMLRNNVGEWNEKEAGKFNYVSNREKVYQYWEERVKETSGMEAMFSLGMRGVHDSGMEGVKSAKEAAPLLEKIFSDQRGMLRKHRTEKVTSIPQVFTAYKEVLDIYDSGLNLPEDVTLVWPDDNYGYIKRLNTPDEKKRVGGTGVYYHASYWGRPHDYLWLGTTRPSLIQSEMMKAYNAGADRLWVLNVGDIKPLEYSIQLFLDMAYQAGSFQKPGFAQVHQQLWLEKTVGEKNAGEIAAIMNDYYNLAFERRPEFMGWSQTEPTTPTRTTAYNHLSFGDEAQLRLDRYEDLQKKVRTLLAQLKRPDKDAFYQLVYYPVVCAAWMNQKFLYAEKARLYAKQNRISAYDFALQSRAAYDSIVEETKTFNTALANGKWNGIMSMEPRGLPVFDAPEIKLDPLQKKAAWNVVPEGYDTAAFSNGKERHLPTFLKGTDQRFFVDVFLCDSVPVNWKAQPSENWIRLSRQGGSLTPVKGKNSLRLQVGVDWKKVPNKEKSKGQILFSAGGITYTIAVQVEQPQGPANYKGFIETNGYISMHAGNFTTAVANGRSAWNPAPGLGHTNKSLLASVTPSITSGNIDTASIRKNAAVVSYDFYSFSTNQPTFSFYTLPTHPLNANAGMRYGVCIDDGPTTILDFETVGRSEEWKQNVLRNSAIKTWKGKPLKPGKHTLKIYTIDPGVVLDRILVSFDDVPQSYSVVPESIKN